MKIIKLVHSCILVESNQSKILVDPGAYSWQDPDVRAHDLTGLSAVVVTHNHPDHLNEEFAKAIKQSSPDAKWYGTQQTAEQLSALGIDCSTTSQDANIKFVDSSHADLLPWFPEQPEHTSFILFDDVLVSGDCQSFTSAHGARILAGAINGGPWGAVVGFSKMIASMEERPEIVVPLHDWHWNQSAKAAIYERLPQVMSQFDVEFIPLEDCVSKDV